MAGPDRNPSKQDDWPAATEWPAYWLVRLEHAITEGNFAAAAQAQQQLRRLGWDVTVRPLPRAESST
jgi:hypothetical protein